MRHSTTQLWSKRFSMSLILCLIVFPIHFLKTKLVKFNYTVLCRARDRLNIHWAYSNIVNSCILASREIRIRVSQQLIGWPWSGGRRVFLPKSTDRLNPYKYCRLGWFVASQPYVLLLNVLEFQLLSLVCRTRKPSHHSYTIPPAGRQVNYKLDTTLFLVWLF